MSSILPSVAPSRVEQRQTSDAERVDQVARHARNLPADHPWTAGSYRLQTIERCPNAWSSSRSKSSSWGRRDREPLTSSDSKSGGHLERVVIDGERYIVKHIHVDDDWIMRSDRRRAMPSTARVDLGIDRPASLQHRYRDGRGRGRARPPWVGRRACSCTIDPSGSCRRATTPCPSTSTSASSITWLRCTRKFWDWEDDVGLTPYDNRWSFFCSHLPVIEAARWVDRRGAADQCTRLGAIRRTSR